MRFLGVDPSGDPVRIANEQGLPTLHAFFNDETAGKIARKYGKADAITACGVFGHIADLAGMMTGAKRLLAPGGVFATDSQYWLDMVLRLHYDNIFHTLFNQVYELTSQGKTVVGLGAPAKASTICNYCRLGPERVRYVTEINPLRIGKFLPGVRIPIVDEERMFGDQPDAGILFAWNYYDEIVPKLRARGFRGEVLLP